MATLTRDIAYIIERAEQSENVSEKKAWLLTGNSFAPNNYQIQYQEFMLNMKLGDVSGTASCFEKLFRRFPNEFEQIDEVCNAVRTYHLSKGKENEEQSFLVKVFNSLQKELQMEVLLRSEQISNNQFEKCQYMLLLVKLYPDTIPRHGPNLLFNLLSYKSEPFSTFRKLLVCELIPGVLQLSKNLGPHNKLLQLMHLCIEYYIMVAKDDDQNDRWEKLFSIVDQLGEMLEWNLVPFFTNSASYNVESYFLGLARAFENRYCSPIELAYISGVLFLRCIVCYNEMIQTSGKFGEKAKLVEIFTTPLRITKDITPAVSITVSNCTSITGNQSQLLSYFITACKIWQLVNSRTDKSVEKEFFNFLHSLEYLEINSWKNFQDFTLDYQTYTGQFCIPDPNIITSNIKMASYYCAISNYRGAAEFALKSVSEYNTIDSENSSNSKNSTTNTQIVSSKEDFSFFGSNNYIPDINGQIIQQRRVHFISGNKSEIISYAGNILIRCLYELMNFSYLENDYILGHLMTILQLEWKSYPAEVIFTEILELIKRKGTFQYYPYFGDYVIEPDFLEEFMAYANANRNVSGFSLELFNSGTKIGNTGLISKKMTRGMDRGSKNDFKVSMCRQMMKNENVETLILRFMTKNKNDILACFDAQCKP